MVSVLVEDLPPATVGFLHRRARRAGAASAVDQVRHELIAMAREPDPVDEVVRFVEQHHAEPPRPDVDPDAMVLAATYALPADVWSTLCRRAAVSRSPVSRYVHDELVRLSRHTTVEDVMWEFGEAQKANPSLDLDLDAVLAATRYARGLD